jgi:hypothetical protein
MRKLTGLLAGCLVMISFGAQAQEFPKLTPELYDELKRRFSVDSL